MAAISALLLVLFLVLYLLAMTWVSIIMNVTCWRMAFYVVARSV